MKKRPLISFDWALKRLLRQKANFGILEGFLSTLLKKDITIISLPESESNAVDLQNKINKVDLLCENEFKELMLIELQYNSEIDYFHRMLFGTSKIITDYMKEGLGYQEVKKVYSINIVYFDLGHGTDYVYHGSTHFNGIHDQDSLQLTLNQRNLFKIQDVSGLYPEYYILKVNRFNDIAKDSLDEWIYYLKHNELPKSYHAKGLNMVSEKLKYDKMEKEAKLQYDAHQKELAISYSVIETAKYEAKAEGKAEGKDEGFAEAAVKFYDNGVDITFIAKNLSISEDALIAILKKAGRL